MNEPYIGPAMWIRISHRFGPRNSEWYMSIHTGLWGYALLLPETTFDQPTWAGFRDIFQNENFLGACMLLLGVARFIGLVVNGSRKHVTPQIRQFSAAVGAMIWAGVTYGYWSSGVTSTWIAIYPLFIIIEAVNVSRASQDIEETKRNGSSPN